MATEFLSVLQSGLRSASGALEVLSGIVEQAPSLSPLVTVAKTSGMEEVATRRDGAHAAPNQPEVDLTGRRTETLRDVAERRDPGKRSIRRDVQRSLMSLMTSPEAQEAAFVPRSAEPTGPPVTNPSPLRRYAFGGGDLAGIGVTPAEVTGFRETRRSRSRLGPHQVIGVNGSLVTGYIASNALQAILQLVDESVARQMGNFRP